MIVIVIALSLSSCEKEELPFSECDCVSVVDTYDGDLLVSSYCEAYDCYLTYN